MGTDTVTKASGFLDVLVFGEIDVDDTSEAQTVTITNTGSEPLEFDSILFGSSDAYNYSMIDECGDDPLPIGILVGRQRKAQKEY